MRKFFVTGLVILLPLALTFIIVAFVFNLLTEPFVDVVKGVLNYYGWFSQGLWIFSADQLQKLISQVLILILLFFITVFLGAITRWFFIKSFIKFWDYILHRIPFVRSIYKTCQDVIHTIFVTKTNSFKQVVMVRFPNEETWSIGLVTREELPGLPKELDPNLIAVFVPTTPNPTSGFLMLFKKEEVIYLDMKIEDAFKYIISLGVISAPFHSIAKAKKEKEASE